MDRHEGTDWYREFCFPLHDPSREFILNGCTYDAVYRLAAGIRRLQPPGGKDRALACLCTDE